MRDTVITWTALIVIFRGLKAFGSKFGSPASMAGLPVKSSWVKVGPPLSCNGPSLGVVLI